MCARKRERERKRERWYACVYMCACVRVCAHARVCARVCSRVCAIICVFTWSIFTTSGDTSRYTTPALSSTLHFSRALYCPASSDAASTALASVYTSRATTVSFSSDFLNSKIFSFNWSRPDGSRVAAYVVLFATGDTATSFCTPCGGVAEGAQMCV